MKFRMVEERIGENMGPVDWEHPKAKDMPAIWREAEANPSEFMLDTGSFSLFQILALCMYDGWPYWVPTPAIMYIGPLGRAEWAHFDSYSIHPNSIRRRTP